jgi:uncharacterized membrane protein YukC
MVKLLVENLAEAEAKKYTEYWISQGKGQFAAFG